MELDKDFKYNFGMEDNFTPAFDKLTNNVEKRIKDMMLRIEELDTNLNNNVVTFPRDMLNKMDVSSSLEKRLEKSFGNEWEGKINNINHEFNNQRIDLGNYDLKNYSKYNASEFLQGSARSASGGWQTKYSPEIKLPKNMLKKSIKWVGLVDTIWEIAKKIIDNYNEKFDKLRREGKTHKDWPEGLGLGMERRPSYRKPGLLRMPISKSGNDREWDSINQQIEENVPDIREYPYPASPWSDMARGKVLKSDEKTGQMHVLSSMQNHGYVAQPVTYFASGNYKDGTGTVAKMAGDWREHGDDASESIKMLTGALSNLRNQGSEQLRELTQDTNDWSLQNQTAMAGAAEDTTSYTELTTLSYDQVNQDTTTLMDSNRAMSENAVVDYGNARTAVTGWGDETETSFYNAETAASGWGDNTMLAFAGVGQEAGALGNDISGMGDIFNSAMGSMGQIGDQMFSGFETTAQNVIQGLITGDIKNLGDAWDTLASGMEGIWQSTLNNLLSSFTNWISSLITNFAQAGLNDLFSYISGGTGGNLGNYFNNIGGRPGPGAGPMGSGVPGGTMNWAGAGGGIVGGIAGAYAGSELGEAIGGDTGRSVGGMVGGIAGSVGGYKLATWLATEAVPQVAAQVGVQVGAQVATQAAEWAAINAEIGAGMAAEGGMNLGSLAALASPAGAMAAAMAPGVIGSLISQYNLFGIGNSPKSRADVREEVDYAQSQVQAYSTDAGYMQGAEYGARAQDAAKALMYGPQIEGEYSVEEWQAIIDSIDALGQKFLESGQKALEFDGSVTSLFERMAASEGSMTMHSLEAMAYTEEIEELAASLGFSGEAALQFQTELEALRESYALGGEEGMLFNDRMDMFVEDTLRAADNTGLLKDLVDELSTSLGLGSEQSLMLGAAINELFTDIKGQGGDLSDFEDQITELASAFGLGSKETEILRHQLQELSTEAMANAENGISGVQTAVDDMNRKFGECGGVLGGFSDTIDGANSHVDVFATALDDLPDDIDIEVSLTPKPGRNQLGVSIRDQQIDLNWMHDGGLVGEPERYHAGDLIRSLAHDEVPIIAQRGEFMVRASNVNAATLPTLRAINGGAMAAPTGPNIIIQGPLVEVNGLSLDSPQVMEDVARAIEGQLRDLQNSRWQA